MAECLIFSCWVYLETLGSGASWFLGVFEGYTQASPVHHDVGSLLLYALLFSCCPAGVQNQQSQGLQTKIYDL